MTRPAAGDGAYVDDVEKIGVANDRWRRAPPDDQGAVTVMVASPPVSVESAVVGTFGAGSCRVAPGGRTSCWLPYDAVDPDSLGGVCESYLGSSCVVQMIGDLTPGAGGVSGGGSFILGSAPAIFYENGQWSAAK